MQRSTPFLIVLVSRMDHGTISNGQLYGGACSGLPQLRFHVNMCVAIHDNVFT